VPQLIPKGEDVTVPEPVPAFATFKLEPLDCSVKFAVTKSELRIKTLQVALRPVHAPLQPVNEEPDAGVAVSVT